MGYQWDLAKAISNRQKHGVDFADAIGAFEDPYAITIDDPEAEGEQRFVTLGLDFSGRLVVVVYVYRGDAIRLISARLATKKEIRNYEKRI